MGKQNFDTGDNTRNYFNSSQDAIFLLSRDYGILDLNNSAKRQIKDIHGKEARVGDNFLHYIEAPEVEIFKCNFKKTLEGSATRQQSLVPVENQEIWDTVNFMPLMDGDGMVYGVIFQKAMMVERKQPEMVVNESEYRLKLVLEGANVGWWDWNLETGMHYFDPKWWAMIGYRPNELPINNTFRKIIYHPDDVHLIALAFNNALKSGQSYYEVEYRMVHKNGSSVPVLSRGYISRDASGLAIRVSGTNMDLTERKKAEAEHQQSENYLRNIFKNTEIGYMFLGTDLQILSFNQIAQTIAISLNKQEIAIGGNILDFVNEERQMQLKESLMDAFEGMKIEYDRVISNDKNEDEWYHLKFSPVLNRDEKVVNVILSLENITERKKNEIQLNKSFDLVNAQNKRLMSFSYIVSHNLRSHASNIISIVDFLSEADTESERDEMIKHMKDVSKSLDDTLSNLNDIISIHTNINLMFEPLFLNTYIKKAIDVLREQIYVKDATILNNVGKDVIINYNPAYLESILLNFMSNAIKYSHPERNPIVTLDYLLENNKLVLLISDNGIGINMKKNGEKLFGLYKTFNGNPDARGLGLFITKNQVEFMGGRIEVESEIGNGTTFKIHF